MEVMIPFLIKGVSFFREGKWSWKLTKGVILKLTISTVNLQNFCRKRGKIVAISLPFGEHFVKCKPEENMGKRRNGRWERKMLSRF